MVNDGMTLLHQAAQKAVELKPCPFCGGMAYRHELIEHYPAGADGPAGSYSAWFHIGCNVCGIEVGDEYESAAVAAWNRRSEAALQHQEVPREPVARPSMSMYASAADYSAAMDGWIAATRQCPACRGKFGVDCQACDLCNATGRVPSATRQQEVGSGPDAMEAHRTNGLAWVVSCWEAEVKNRPLVNVHRRTLDDTWRQVVRYFGGDPDKLLGPNHDTLHMRAQEERAWKP